MNLKVGYFLLLCSINAFTNSHRQKEGGKAKEKKKTTQVDVKLFTSLLLQRRAEHKAAVKTLLEYGDYAKQYKMIQILAEKAFEILQESQVKLREAGFIPGMPFPQDKEVKEAFSHTIEKTLLLGEVLLHLPDITHRLLYNHKPWQLTLTWGVFFVSQSDFFDESTNKLVYLMSQELDLAEKDPDFFNPYRKPKKGTKQKPVDTSSGKPKEERKKRKTFKKGPMLSRQFGDL